MNYKFTTHEQKTSRLNIQAFKNLLAYSFTLHQKNIRLHEIELELDVNYKKCYLAILMVCSSIRL